jgi:hypothetical protein
MSIKLRHPQSLVSTWNARSTIGSPPIKPVPYNDAMDTIDFGTALKEWGTGGQRTAGVRVTGDLSSIVGSSRRIMGDQTIEQGKQYSVANSEILDEAPEQLEQFRRSQDTAIVTPKNEGLSLVRIKSIGNAPRRVRPQPIVGHTSPGSLHLHPLVIPSEGSGPRDVRDRS